MNTHQLRALRNKKGYTQTKFAEILSIDRTYYNMIENNKKEPSLKLLTRIAKELNVSIKKFF